MTPQPLPQPGDRATNYRIGKTDYIAQTGKGRKSDQVYARFESGGPPFPLSDCTPGPEYSAPLSDSDVEAISFWLASLVAAGEYTASDRDMLGTLTGAQKGQVWEKLSRVQKRELKRLTGQLTAA